MTSKRPATILRDALSPGDPLSLDEATQLVGGDRRVASRALEYLVDRGDFRMVRKRLAVKAGAARALIASQASSSRGRCIAGHGPGDRTACHDSRSGGSSSGSPTWSAPSSTASGFQGTRASRLGFLLAQAGRPFDESHLLLELERRRSRSPVYLDPTRTGGHLVARWNVIVAKIFPDAGYDVAGVGETQFQINPGPPSACTSRPARRSRRTSCSSRRRRTTSPFPTGGPC